MKIVLLVVFCVLPSAAEIPQLSAAFGANGLTSLDYQGFNFIARGTFRLLSVQFTSANGGRKVGQTNGWAIANSSGSGEVITLDWGTIQASYRVQDSRLYLTIDTTNRSDATLDALSYEPLVLKFPQRPREYDGTTPILESNVGSPTIATMTYATGVVALCNEDARQPLLVGFPWALDRPRSTVFPLRINTGRGEMYPLSLPFIQRPISPGHSDRICLSLRFSAGNAAVSELAGDVLNRFRSAYPFKLHWADRRPIVSLIVASAATGWKSNPRGWLHDSTIDITTQAGISAFHQKLLAWADRSISLMKNLNAQGMIVWDLEGEQFPHPISYIGDPRLSEALAPELGGVLDEFFHRFRNAGFRVGITIRPQELVLATDRSSATQVNKEDSTETLVEKIAYARKRWGATLFYIDSNGDASLPLSFEVIRSVADAFPDVLLIPEHKNAAYYSVSAPYIELRHGHAATPSSVRDIYAQAFSVINTAGADVANHHSDLAAAVVHGDILMRHGWSEDLPSADIRSIYSSANGVKRQ